MGRHKQMPGKTYKIIFQNDQEAKVICTYLCPYCNLDTTVQITVNATGFDLLESGGFYEPLECPHCNKISDVRFWQSSRI
ncbi:hypothetical protein SAMN05216375_1024 [Trichococcus ilyis]|uniref:Uncharacterized protein n=1 Tax=Trichococcus ilyis TaxID=640938 RepID=A0A143YGM5_9LACT|nr:Hypothetical protein TR210_528 [Trichococcus ilyis]SEI61323.1 hypothetical protein SAMN05216375_1024 [Trichococcus ilyis]